VLSAQHLRRKQSKRRNGKILQQANPSLPVTWRDDGVISLVISSGSPVQAENRRFGDYGNVLGAGPLGGDRPPCVTVALAGASSFRHGADQPSEEGKR
jgi:hypothetical protein